MRRRSPLAALVGLAVRRPVLVVGLACVLALAGVVLASRLEVSAGTDTLVGGGSSTAQATDRWHEQFGDDAVFVMVRGELDDVFLTANLNRVIGLEGCIAGNAPPGVDLPGGAGGPCAKLRETHPTRTVFGPGTFINESVNQLQGQLAARQQTAAEQADAARRQAREQAREEGLTGAAVDRAGEQAAQAAQSAALRQMLELGVRYGLTDVPRVNDPNFVAKLIFDPTQPLGTPKERFAYLFPSPDTALITVRLEPGLGDTERREAIEQIRAAAAMPEFRMEQGGRFTVTGAPVVVADLTESITGSIILLLVAALLVMAATLALVFRTRLRLAPLAVALGAAALTFGALALVGAPLTMASIAVLPVLIGLAVDYAIQLQSRVEEARAGRPPEAAVATAGGGEPGAPEAAASPTAQAARQVARAGAPTIVTAAAATAAGFAVLALSPVPMVRGFGLLLVVGIVLALALALTAGMAAMVLVHDGAGTPGPRARRLLAVLLPAVRGARDVVAPAGRSLRATGRGLRGAAVEAGRLLLGAARRLRPLGAAMAAAALLLVRAVRAAGRGAARVARAARSGAARVGRPAGRGTARVARPAAGGAARLGRAAGRGAARVARPAGRAAAPVVRPAAPVVRPARSVAATAARGLRAAAGALLAAVRGVPRLPLVLRDAALGLRFVVTNLPANLRAAGEGSLHLALARPGRVLAVAAAVAALGWALDTQTEVESDIQRLVPQDMAALSDLEELQRSSGVGGEVDVLVEADDVTDPAVLGWMARYQAGVLERFGHQEGRGCGRADVCPAFSLPDLLQLAPGQTPDAEQIDALLAAVPDYFSRSVLSPGRDAATLAFGVRLMSLAEQEAIYDEMRRRLDPPPGVDATLVGLPVLAAEANAQVSSYPRRLLTLLAGLLAVAFVLAAVLRSPRRALLPLVPIALATGWSALVLYTLQVPLNPMSVTLGALVIAISTEFSVLLSERYRAERARGLPPAGALRRTYASTGRAVLASGATAIAGFAVLVVSDIRMLRDFGAVTVVDLTVSLLGVLVVLPAVLVAAERPELLGIGRLRRGRLPRLRRRRTRRAPGRRRALPRLRVPRRSRLRQPA